MEQPQPQAKVYQLTPDERAILAELQRPVNDVLGAILRLRKLDGPWALDLGAGVLIQAVAEPQA